MTPHWQRFERYWPRSRTAKAGSLAAIAGLALAGSGVIAQVQARRAEQKYRPLGRMTTVDGVRLHYIERGRGRPVLFLHGNGAMVEDVLISGLAERASRQYRFIAFDRPGFGHSERPRGRHWTATAQASLMARALQTLGVERAIVVGHSWGTLVALALAVHYPRLVEGLVLASGYYYPTPRLDVAIFSPPAIPLVGDLISYTVAPFIGEAMAPAMIKGMFAPQGVPPRFAEEFPVALTVRPSQIKAFSEDTAHMRAAAEMLSHHYRSLFPPTAILAGDCDQVVSYRQAQRLHGDVAGSTLDIFKGGSHMLHHLDPARVVFAINRIGAASQPSRAAV